MRFQYVSDAHVDQADDMPAVAIEAGAPYLIVAGDVGSCLHPNFTSFFELVCPLFERVFFVAGNHEYFLLSIEAGEKMLREKLQPFPNVTYLQNEVYHFPDSDISVWGGTLWTHIPIRDAAYVRRRISDYRMIRNFTPSACTKLHTAARASLDAALETHPGRRWIAVSHHLPRRDLTEPKWLDTASNVAFATDVPAANDPRIVAWVYGHTHCKGVVGKFRCSPIGYPGENRVTSYNETLCLD